MPETLRSSSLLATPSNTGEGEGSERGGEPGAGFSLAAAVTCLLSPEGAAGAHFPPRMLPWVEVVRATRRYPVVSAGKVGNLGFHKESGCRNGDGSSRNFDIKEGWVVRKSWY